MAAIRMSRSLVEAITTNLMNPFSERIKKITEEIHDLDFFGDIEDEATPTGALEHARALYKDNPDWLRSGRYIIVKVDDPEFTETNIVCRICVPDGRFVPPNLYEFTFTPGMKHYDTILEKQRTRRKAAEEKDKVYTALVEGVLKTKRTLRQVIKVWPSVVDFLPPEVLEEHNRVVPKTKRKTEEEEVHIPADVKASLITLKLT